MNWIMICGKEIQNVIEHKPISENILLINFKIQIEKLDSELKKHILIFEEVV